MKGIGSRTRSLCFTLCFIPGLIIDRIVPKIQTLSDLRESYAIEEILFYVLLRSPQPKNSKH
jgi:hypothetical protein